MQIDVALVPAEARTHDVRVLIVIDEIRASTTITTLLDLDCRELVLAGTVPAARRIAAERGSLLAGERHAVKPRGFDYDNSPTDLMKSAKIRGRSVVLCTTNGTAVLRRLRGAPHVLVGCVRNATACAEAAVRLATADGCGVQVVCAGQRGRFVLDDAAAAGVVVERLAEAARRTGAVPELSDAAETAVRLRRSFPDLLTAMRESNGGRTLVRIGQAQDIAFCAEEDASTTVPVLLATEPMRIGALA